MSDLLQVARLAGVSRATAARAFSAPHLLKAATRQKVLAASEELGFRPNHIARQLRTQSSSTLGVVLPSLHNPVFAQQLQAMEQMARQAGYALLISTTDYQPHREAVIVEDMLRQRVAGLVLTVADADTSVVLQSLAAEKVPFVLAHNVPGHKAYAAIGVDNRLAVYQATELLLTLGHRRIGMIAGPMLQSDRARQRYQGYCHAMQAAGLTVYPVIEMPSHTQSRLDDLLPWIRQAQPLTALLCSNDMLAISVMGEAMRAGFAVPEQLSIMGFDGIDIGQHLFPSLSSVVQPLNLLGECAIRQLLAQLQGQGSASCVLSHHLRRGESIAAPDVIRCSFSSTPGKL